MVPERRTPILERVLAPMALPILMTSPQLGLLSGGLSTSGIAVVIGLLVISLGIHEAAHAQVALWCGDTTARDLGRITLNPIPHIDPFMTILLPLMLYFGSGGRMMFGGAKPVPVVYRNLRSPLRDMTLVAIAGPLSNFLLAVLFALVYRAFVLFGLYQEQMMLEILLWGVNLNLLLAAFNLVPIPPLDGSRVMTWLLPDGLRRPYVELERYGMIILIVILLLERNGFDLGFYRFVYWAMDGMRALSMDLTNPFIDLLRPLAG